jgi:hypothetical protein
MQPDEPDEIEPAHAPEGDGDKEAALAQKREALLSGALAGEEDTLEKRVAIILNHYPETRDSDLKLQLRYWGIFEGYDGGSITPGELFERTRLTSLTRSRAKIQNTYRLFQASPDIRKRRGKLSDDEYQKALETSIRFPTFAVYMDESGKTAQHLIVASIWFSHAEETLSLTRKLATWRTNTGFKGELHFKDLDGNTASYYLEALKLLLSESTSVSFKAISVPREGVGRVDEALEEMLYHLLVDGVQHEHSTGRSPLPRSLQVWKDLEERGRDKLLLANLKDRVIQAGNGRFNGQLTVDEFEAVESHKFDLMQLADLFAGSLNRFLNATGARSRPKDRFARHLLELVGMPEGPTGPQRVGDLTVLMKL